MNWASAEALTGSRANTAACDTRARGAAKVERTASIGGANDVGILLHEAGHRCVPAAPSRISGVTLWSISRIIILEIGASQCRATASRCRASSRTRRREVGQSIVWCQPIVRRRCSAFPKAIGISDGRARSSRTWTSNVRSVSV